MNNDFKPCPFCGNEEISIQRGQGNFLVSCPKCKVRTRFYCKGTIEQKIQYAKDAWNRRTHIEVTQQDIKDMLQLLNDIPNSSPGHNDYRFKNTYAICSFLSGKLRELEG